MKEYKMISTITLIALIVGMGISEAHNMAANTKQCMHGFTKYKLRMDLLRGTK